MEHLTNYVKYRGNYYYISTVKLPTTEVAYETMIFNADEDDTVTDWIEVFARRYHTENEARESHKYIVNHIEEFLGEPENEPEVSLKNEQKSEEEKTVRITSKQLQEALAEAFTKECDKFFEDDKAKGLLFGMTFGAAICANVVTKFFGEEKEND